MSRKRCRRRVTMPMPPRGLRPMLDAGQRLDLGLVHHANLDAIARGEADEATLWHWAAGVMTWSRVAEQLRAGVDEMKAQLQLAESLLIRYGRTGRIAFTGPEYQLAKAGVAHMDDLAAIVDRPTAIAAADWSEAVYNQWTTRPASVLGQQQEGAAA